MTDTNKLKELAERATPGPWVRTVDGVMPEEGPSLICSAWGFPNMPGNLEFIAAANPKAILGLIAEIDGLLAQHGRDSAELRALCQARDDVRKERDRLKAENEALRQFAAEAYQVFGALDAPENVLDNASDAANGDQLRHKTLLPFFAESYEALRKDAERYKALRQKDPRSTSLTPLTPPHCG